MDVAVLGSLEAELSRRVQENRVDPLELVRLPGMMALTSGRADLVVGLLDGPVALDHPDLATRNVRALAGKGACREVASASCRHGTFVAGILVGRRGGQAPAIAPDCTLLVRPVFSDAHSTGQMPSATPRDVAEAIVDCVDAGAKVLNLSAAPAGESSHADCDLEEALRYVVQRGVLMVAAAGNQGAVVSSAITRHPSVIPVIAYVSAGRPLAQSNVGRSIGIGGLGGPGHGVVSLAPGGETAVSGGTSIAAAFVTGAAALLWSLFPVASAGVVKRALLSASVGRRRTVTPRLMDAWGAYEVLSGGRARTR
jgi:subtilisin family serine protease